MYLHNEKIRLSRDGQYGRGDQESEAGGDEDGVGGDQGGDGNQEEPHCSKSQVEDCENISCGIPEGHG